jgi:hypothetical protein
VPEWNDLGSLPATGAEYRVCTRAGVWPALRAHLHLANLGSREQSDPDEGDRALPRRPPWIGAIVFAEGVASRLRRGDAKGIVGEMRAFRARRAFANGGEMLVAMAKKERAMSTGTRLRVLRFRH